MSLSVKAFNYGSEICREWAESVKRRPLQKGVSRFVTIAKDDTTRVLGKDGEFFISQTLRADGLNKTILKAQESAVSAKKIVYPDGSYSATCYLRTKPFRTDGVFILKTKDGKLLKHEYKQDGYLTPQEAKKIHLSVLEDIGNPNKEVDLREVFGNRPKSKILRFFGDVKYKVGKFFERFNKTNTEWRRYAKSIDMNA